MDNGSWGDTVYDLKPYMIIDQKEFFSIWENNKQIASFKEKDKAFQYVEIVRHLDIDHPDCPEIFRRYI